AAGFSVTVAKKKVPSTLPAGLVAMQSREPGTATKGIEVIISLRDGAGIDIPVDVLGMTPNNAKVYLESLGFTNVALGTCTEDLGAPLDGIVTSTNPPTGSATNSDKPILIHYSRPICP